MIIRITFLFIFIISVAMALQTGIYLNVPTEAQEVKSLSYSDAIEKIRPAVVYIQANITDEVASTGTGFIVRSDGYIITCLHVLNGAKKITVYVNNKEQYAAEKIFTDEGFDIAILKIDVQNLKTVKLGDSPSKPGDDILVDGYPLLHPGAMPLYHSTNRGIISAIVPPIKVSEGKEINYIKSDVRVDPGNSGGPAYIIKTNYELRVTNYELNWKGI